MEKWEDKKKFSFPHLGLVGGGKVKGWKKKKKKSLYKFTHKLLLKVDVQLKKKIDKQPTKRQSPKFIKKEKSCPEKRKKVKKKKIHFYVVAI